MKKQSSPSTPYERLERLKVEADRWLAGVSGSLGDSTMLAEASRGLRELLDKATAFSSSETPRIEISRYVNAADISGADVPHVVVEKLQRAARKIYSSTHGEGHTTGVGGHEERVTVITPSDKVDRSGVIGTHESAVLNLINTASDLENVETATAAFDLACKYGRQLDRDASAPSSAVAPQVVGRVWNDEGQGRAQLNSVGRALPDDTTLYAAPVSATDALDAARYRRLRENWVDCAELGLHGRLSVIDAEIDKRISDIGESL